MTQRISGPRGRAGSRTMRRARRPGRVVGAICGVLAAAVAIGIAQFLAGLSIPAASPVIAVGQAAIDLTPLPVKDWATSTFGTEDKTVLLLGVFVVLFLFAVVVGILAMRRLWLGLAGLCLFAVIGLVAALTRHGASAAYALPTLCGAAVGAFALYRLVTSARSASPSAAAEPLPPIVFDSAAAAIGEFAGRELATRRNVSAARSALRFPRAAVPAPPLPAGVNLPVPGISPFITPNGQFYRVDTALLVPQVDPASWRLRIHGMVAREVEVSFAELLRRPLIEDYITLCCVSNPVGGPYIGNAKWLGVSLASLLRSARPQSGASQLLCTSADGFTSGTPLSVVMDGRDALVAVAMNGAALPVEHGFPARLVVPGLYGYVSACKWVTDIEVTTFQAATAYWVQRGWAQQGPIKTESRIDVPAPGSQVKAGQVAVAGVAWAQHKGIEAVEVRVDGGPWQQATLAAVPDIDTWRQWVWRWDASAAGPHLIEARATDKTGYTQTAVQADVAPNGASGYPSSQVTVYRPA